MSTRLRYSIETSHDENIAGRIINADLSFAIHVGGGQYSVDIDQDTDRNGGAGLRIHGGTLPELIGALKEIADLYAEAVGRYSRATAVASSRDE